MKELSGRKATTGECSSTNQLEELLGLLGI